MAKAELKTASPVTDELVTDEPVEDELTAASPVTVKTDTIPRVAIILPLLEDADTSLRMDQYEHVTVNGVTTLVKRGERVEVTVPVYIQLRNKFPFI